MLDCKMTSSLSALTPSNITPDIYSWNSWAPESFDHNIALDSNEFMNAVSPCCMQEQCRDYQNFSNIGLNPNTEVNRLFNEPSTLSECHFQPDNFLTPLSAVSEMESNSQIMESSTSNNQMMYQMPCQDPTSNFPKVSIGNEGTAMRQTYGNFTGDIQAPYNHMDYTNMHLSSRVNPPQDQLRMPAPEMTLPPHSTDDPSSYREIDALHIGNAEVNPGLVSTSPGNQDKQEPMQSIGMLYPQNRGDCSSNRQIINTDHSAVRSTMTMSSSANGPFKSNENNHWSNMILNDLEYNPFSDPFKKERDGGTGFIDEPECPTKLSTTLHYPIMGDRMKSPQKRKVGRPPKKDKKHKRNEKKTGRLWEFIRDLLKNPDYCPSLVRWENPEEGHFRFVNSEKVAQLWGNIKGNPKMTYEKLSRAMRYYYKSQVFEPVLGRRLVYKFGVKATNWKPVTNFNSRQSFTERR